MDDFLERMEREGREADDENRRLPYLQRRPRLEAARTLPRERPHGRNAADAAFPRRMWDDDDDDDDDGDATRESLALRAVFGDNVSLTRQEQVQQHSNNAYARPIMLQVGREQEQPPPRPQQTANIGIFREMERIADEMDRVAAGRDAFFNFGIDRFQQREFQRARQQGIFDMMNEVSNVASRRTQMQHHSLDSSPQWPLEQTTDPFLKSTVVVDFLFEQEWPKERARLETEAQLANQIEGLEDALEMARLTSRWQLHDQRRRYFRSERLLRAGVARRNRREASPLTNRRAFLHRRRMAIITEISMALEEGSREAEQTRDAMISGMLQAVVECSTELLKLVVLVDEFHADINGVLPNNSFPLEVAASIDSQNYFSPIFLLLRGATAFDRNGTNLENLFRHVANNDSFHVTRILLGIGVNVDTPDRNGYTQLYRAVKSYNKQQALMLARHSEDLDRQYDERQTTILHLATFSMSSELVSELLLRGANPLIQDIDGRSPLMYACELHRFSMIHPICRSAKQKGQKVLRQQDKDGKYALHFIAVHVASPVDHQFRVIRYMLSNGNTFEDRCNEGKSILHYLVASPAQLLLSRTMELEPRFDLASHVDNQGQTLLHSACINMRATKVQYLLDLCPELFHTKDNAGRAAFHATLCAPSRDGDRAKLLKKLFDHLECNGGSEEDKVALINSVDNVGWTPLHLACFYSLRRCVIFLLDHGANLETADLKGRRPLHISFFSAVVVAPMNYGREAELVSQVLGGNYNEEEVTANPTPVISLPRTLVLRGADTCAPDSSGNLAFFVGAMFNQVQALFWMIHAGTSQGLFSM